MFLVVKLWRAKNRIFNCFLITLCVKCQICHFIVGLFNLLRSKFSSFFFFRCHFFLPFWYEFFWYIPNKYSYLMLNIYLSNVSSVKYTLIDCYFTQMNSKYSLDTMSESVSARDRGRREGLPGSGCYSHVGQLICLFYCEEKLRFWHIFEYHLVQAYFAELPT